MRMSCVEICEKVRNILEPLGFESYPFKVGWYNEKVMNGFQLPFDTDTLAFIVVSTPAMFDQAFKPFILQQECVGEKARDLMDTCITRQFSLVQQAFPDHAVECIHDYELHHSRRPKVLVQTAGHVAGAAYYYQRTDVMDDPWPPSQKICGVSIHPQYGGWFALRGVILFRDVLAADLQQKSPPDVVSGDKLRIELLERFNFHWKDWTFRDIVPVTAVYCQELQDYFRAPPAERHVVINKIRENAKLAAGNGWMQTLVDG